MNAYASSIEFEAISSRTRKTVGLSIAIHVLIVLWLLLQRTVSPPPPALTEISWIDPVVIQPPKPTVNTRIVQPAMQNNFPSPKQEPAHFVRKTTTSDFAPDPQKRDATEDILQRKLASLERRAVQSNTRIAGIAEASNITQPRLASVPNEASSGDETVRLSRQMKSAAPVALTRSEPVRRAPAVNLTEVPEKKVTQAKIDESESTARRILDGASLVGPVADRPLVSYGMPAYPEWAKRDGVEATVNLYFIVLPNGEVKENILIQKTSGFADFDDRAVAALRKWRFEPLKGGATGEQWGSITFNFRLSG
jgi:TonB family protein